MDRNLVSVILPVHNRFPIVDEAIESVWAQSYRPIQLIIVDDCSDKPYVPKIQSNTTFEVNLIRHETNQGPGSSRETGRIAAKGDYIAYLDSDDLWHPEKTNQQLALMEKNPQVGMCYCTSVVFSSLPFSGEMSISKNSDQLFDSFLPILFHGRPWDTSACLWKRHAVELIGPWITSWTWEDIEYDCRAGCHDITIIGLPEVLCYYRESNQWQNLSKTPRSHTYQARITSLTEMKKNLIKFNKHKIEIIRSAFESMVFRHIIAMFFSEDKTHGLTSLKILFSVSVGARKLMYAGLISAGQILGSKDMGRLCYKLRTHILLNTIT